MRRKPKPSKGWSIFDLVALFVVVSSIWPDIKQGNWNWAAAWVGMALFFIWEVHRDWAWYPPVKNEDQDHDKTKELRETWKDKTD